MAQTSVLFLGDIVSSIGVAACRRILPLLREEFSLAGVIVNGENATGGIGLDAKTANDLKSLGIDGITLGDHTWSKKDIFSVLDEKNPWVIRPINFPRGAPGLGAMSITLKNGVTIGVANAIGRVFFNQPLDCPFRAMDDLLSTEWEQHTITILDFHAEASSEKYAMGRYLDGRISLMVGTHTHVQTADDHILPNGTGFISDLGMTGPADGVIGMESGVALDRFLTGLPHSYRPAKGVPFVQGIVASFDEQNGNVISIQRIRREVKV